MSSLLTPGEVCSEVLSIKVKTNIPFQGLDSTSVQFFKNVNFPTFSIFQSYSIKKELLDRTKDHREVLKSYGYKFDIFLDSLNSLYKNSNSSYDYVCYIAAALFHSYMLFEIQLGETSDPMNLVEYLRLLNVTTQEQRFKQIKTFDVIKISNSIFFNALYDHLTKRGIQLLELFLPPLNDYYFFNKDLPSNAYSLLGICGNLVFSNTQTGNDHMQYSFLTIADGLLQQIKTRFPQEVALIILQRSYPSIRKMDIASLSFLYHTCALYGISNVDQIIPCIYILPPALMSLINSLDTFFKLPKAEKTHLICQYRELPNTLEIPQYSTLNGKPLTINQEFADANIESLLPLQIMSKISFLCKTFLTSDQIATTFVESCTPFILGSMDQENISDILIVFLYLLFKISSIYSVNIKKLVLYNQIIFDPNIAVFDSLPDFDPISTIRSTALSLIVRDPIVLRQVLLESASHPLLFAEIVLRLMTYKGELFEDASFISPLSQGILKPLVLYQSLIEAKEAPSDELDTARRAVFTFIFDCLKEKRLEQMFMSSDFFSKAFFKLALEKPLRPTVLSFVEQFVGDPNNSSNPQIEQLFLMVQIFLNSDSLVDAEADIITGKESGAAILTDIFEMINRCVRKVPSLSKFTVKLIDCVFSVIATGKKLASDESFIISFIMMNVLSPQRRLRHFETRALVVAISSFNSDEPSEGLSNALLQLIAGKELSNFKKSFEVKQANAMSLYLEIFQNSKNLLDCISFLSSLCVESMTNSSRAHEGRLDLYIIDLLESMLENSSPDQSIVESLLSLLKQISVHESSVTVVLRYVSLLCPIEGRYLSKIHNNLLQFMWIMIENAKFSPSVSWPMNEGKEIEIKNISFADISNGFSFSFWIFLVPSSNPMTVFKMTDGSDSSFTVSITGQILKVEIDKTFSQNIIERFPANEWTFVSLNLKYSSTCDFSATNDGRIIFDRRDVPAFKPKKLPITVTICSVQGRPEMPSRLGSFALTQQEDGSLYAMGPRSLKPSSAIFAYSPSETSDGFVLQKLTSADFIEASFPSGNVKHNNSFVDILIDSCNVSLLLPLFAQVDMKDSTGEEIPKFLETVISIFKSSLLLSEKAQISFLNDEGFAIMAHLLMRAKPENITYKLYLKFYDILTKLTNAGLVSSLFHNIAFNPSLWINCCPRDNIRILRHWVDVVLKMFPSIVINYRPFVWFINVLHSYYYYLPNESAIAIQRFRGLKFKPVATRKLLFECARQTLEFNFTSNDLIYLIDDIVSINDVRQIMDLLAFLRDLIDYNLLFTIPENDVAQQIGRLHILFRVFNPELFKSVVLTLKMTHDTVLKSVPFSARVYSILNYLRDIHTTKLFVKTALSLIPDVPECLTMACWSAYNIGGQAISMVANYILAKKPKLSPTTSLVWTYACLFKVSSNKQRIILRFLLQSSGMSLPRVFVAVDRIGVALGYCPEDVQHNLLEVFAEFVATGEVRDAAMLLYVSKNFIFTRSANTEKRALIQLFNESPFVTEPMVNQKNIAVTASNEYLYNALSNITYENRNFGTRVEEGKLVDELIIKSALTLSNEGDFAFILAGLLASRVQNTFEMNLQYFETLERFYMSFDSSILQKAFSDFIEQIKLEISRAGLIIHSFNDSLNSVHFDQQVEIEQKLQAKLWQSLWRSLTTERAPWNRSLHKSMRMQFFKRDNTYCNSFCPYKVRRNFKYDDHMKAAFLRDSGSPVDAEERLEQYKADLINHKHQNAPAEILDIDEYLESDNHSSEMSENLSRGIKIGTVSYVTVRGETDFIFTLFPDRFVLNNDSGKVKTIFFKDIRFIFRRTMSQRPTAIEVFTALHRSMFIDFRALNIMAIINVMAKSPMMNPKAIIQTTTFRKFFEEHSKTQEWLNGNISNFEYLMHLNVMSGRTFASTSIYPFFPWIIADYTSEKLDLSKPETFRDLSKPVGALNQKRLEELMAKRDELRSLGMDPYLYSSGQVCPLSVFLWLIRMEPFTSLHIDIQGGRFDHTARIFISIADSFKAVTTHRNSFRELIPEFFFEPEFLLNNNNFDLGFHCGERVSDVILPPWASSAYDFIYLNRRALESEYVSRHLNEWIDLTFGVNSRGENAERCNNVYKAEMYGEIWDNAKYTPEQRAGIEAVLQQVGQIPQQIFFEPHPQKKLRVSELCDTRKPASFKLEVTKISLIGYGELGHKRFLNIVGADGNFYRYRFNISKLLAPKYQRRQRSLTMVQKQLHRVSSVNSIKDYNEGTEANEPPKGLKMFTAQVKVKPSQIAAQFGHSDYAGDDIIYVGRDGSDVFKFNIEAQTTTLVRSHSCDVVFVAADDDYIAIAGRDAHILLIRAGEVHGTIPVFCDSIRSMAISSTFDLLIVGTRDFSLLICSLSRAEIVRVVQTECSPDRIIVTPSMGYIVVSGCKTSGGRLIPLMFLYNVNGSLIRSARLEEEIVAIDSWSDTSGFDFLLVGDRRGRLFAFEAFPLQTGMPILRMLNVRFTAVKFFPKDNVAIIVIDSSLVYIQPFTPKYSVI